MSMLPMEASSSAGAQALGAAALGDAASPLARDAVSLAGRVAVEVHFGCGQPGVAGPAGAGAGSDGSAVLDQEVDGVDGFPAAVAVELQLQVHAHWTVPT